MFFSVVIATYNRQTLLVQCLDALFNQTFSQNQYEVIVVDDGSRDDTIEYLKSLSPPVSFKFLQQKHRGPAAARNLGIKHAQGKIIAMTDDDCVPPREWLEKLADGFKRYPKVTGVSGYQEAPQGILKTNLIAQYESYQSRELYGQKEKEVAGGLETPGGVTNNVAFRKSVLDEIGGFDEGFPVPAGEDADLKKRIADCGHQLLYIPLKVEHQQEYSLGRFLHQQYVRGIGSRFFRKKWENKEGINWLLPIKSIVRFFITFLKTKSIRLAGLEFLGRLWMFMGELKYL